MLDAGTLDRQALPADAGLGDKVLAVVVAIEEREIVVAVAE